MFHVQWKWWFISKEKKNKEKKNDRFLNIWYDKRYRMKTNV